MSILGIELCLFSIVLLTIWLDEFVDIPCKLFHAPPTPYRLEEYVIETGMIGTVAVIVMVITWLILRKVERLESFVRVCAWCKDVRVEGRWMSFEKYLESEYRLRATHGICEKCHDKVVNDNGK